MKRICVLSKSDAEGGGASAFAEQLADDYRAKGHDVIHLHLDSKDLHPYGRQRTLIRYLKGAAGRLGYRDHYPFELLSSRLRNLPRKFDFLHLHDMSTVLSAASIKWLARRMPTIWTLHDYSAFTAGCIYPSGCEGFLNTCHQCPALRTWPLHTRFDRTPTLHTGRKALRNEPVYFSAPSQWMVGEYLRAGGVKDKIRFVSNCVDTDVFQPMDRVALRKKHGLGNARGPVIAFSAGWLADQRKGPQDVAKIMWLLEHLNGTLLLMGRWSDEAAQIFQGLDVVHLGFVKSAAERAEFFAMADATLMFSKEENAPLTAIESLATGTPVFGFATGGIPEIVTSGETGFVSQTLNVGEVAEELENMKVWDNPDLRAQCRHRAETFYRFRNVSQGYVDYFQEIAQKGG